MINCYLIGLRVILCLLFAAGLVAMVYGHRKYDFNPLAFLAPFVGGVLSFPIFFALKERYLKKSGAAAEDVLRTHRLTILSWVFVAAFIVVAIAMGVSFFLDKFDEIQGIGDAVPNMEGWAVDWASRLFWGILTVCAAYIVSLCAMGCRKKK